MKTPGFMQHMQHSKDKLFDFVKIFTSYPIIIILSLNIYLYLNEELKLTNGIRC